MKTNKAAGLDAAITAEAVQNGGDAMIDVVHRFCAEVYSSLTPPNQWTTSVIVPLPKKGDLSQMTNYRGISLLSIAAKVYNKILLNRIRDHVDPILRKNQAGFRPGRSCAPADPHPQKDNGRIPRLSAPTHCHLHWYQEGVWLHR